MNPETASNAFVRTFAEIRLLTFVSLVVAMLAGLLFTPGLPGEFVFDDIPNIVNNPAIHLAELNAGAVVEVLATPQVSGAMRGLPTLTFALDFWRAGGADPVTFKTTNIVIHALTALVLVWFFRSLLSISGIPARRAMWIAAALALAWAAHPLHVSAVLYTVQRLQTMGTLFLVLALLAYLQARQAQMQGRPGRIGMLATGLLWAVALGCKEDSALLPAYALALELTVLRFAAADARVTALLRRGYLIVILVGVAAYSLWVIPHHWHWDAYPGRDFSTWERLLTQGRVLCLYLWQIVLPLPQHMPFYYDWVQPSRGLLQPWTTLPAIALICALLVLAWRMRVSRPLFALGIFIFFAAHFIASNVVGLELAYEHRNHFALIGAVLALGGLLAQVCQRLRLRPAVQASLCVALLAALGGATVQRAHDWRSNVSLALASAAAAPGSPRAWIELCASQFKAGGGVVQNNSRLDDAIDACASGADAEPDTLNSLALLVVLKTVRGDVSAQDWQRFQQRLGSAHMSWDNIRAPLIFGHYASQGVTLDKDQVLAALASLDRRVSLRPHTLVSIGHSIMNDFGEPGLAVPYFVRALEAVPPGDPFARELAADLRAKGRPDLAETIERVGLPRSDAAPLSGEQENP